MFLYGGDAQAGRPASLTYGAVARIAAQELEYEGDAAVSYTHLDVYKRQIRERMNVRDNEVFTPVDLINAKTLSSVINSFSVSYTHLMTSTSVQPDLILSTYSSKPT